MSAKKPVAKKPVARKIAAKPRAAAMTAAVATKTAKAERPARLPADTKIVLLKTDKVLRGSRAERVALVKSGMTVAQLAEKLKAGGYSVSAGAQVNWMVATGLAKIG